MDKITPGKHVTISYKLYEVHDDGSETLVFDTADSQPQEIIYGLTNVMITPLEEELEGKEKGYDFDVKAVPDQAYGEYLEDRILHFTKDMLQINGEFNPEIVAVGKYVPMVTEDGYMVEGLVTSIDGDDVTIDFNHRLAGKTVRVTGTVDDVRDATPEEMHLAVGGGCCGHGGCGGGCGENGCGDEPHSCCGGESGSCGCGK